MSADDRAGLLDEAKGYVTKDRNASYGEPEDNFSNIAEIWNAQGFRFGGGEGVRPITSTDVALMMVGMKLARLKHNPTHHDSWVDAAGYVACGYDTVAPKHTSLTDMEAGVKGKRVDAFRATLEEVNERIAAEGWLGDNRCGNARDHEPHSYSSGSRGFDALHTKNGDGYWCDGYVSNPRKRKQARDIETVKRVADRR